MELQCIKFRAQMFWWNRLSMMVTVEMTSCSSSTKVTGAGICTDLWLFAPGQGEAEGLEAGLLVHAGHDLVNRVQQQQAPSPLTKSPTNLALQPHSWRWALDGPALDCGTLAGRKPRPGPSVGGGGGGGTEDGGCWQPHKPHKPHKPYNPQKPHNPSSSQVNGSVKIQPAATLSKPNKQQHVRSVVHMSPKLENIARIANAVQCLNCLNCQVTKIVMNSGSQLSEL